MRGQGKSSRFVVALLALSALLGVNAAAASAAPSATPTYGYFATFGAGELGSEGAQFNRLGVDSHGNIVVAVYNSSEVRIYAPDPILGGTPLTTFSAGGPLAAPTALAVDPETDALFVQDGRIIHIIGRFVSDGQPTPTYNPDPGFSPVGDAASLAVDPTSHDLLAADSGARLIKRIDTTGAEVGTIPTPSIEPQHIAAAPDGSIYVAGAGNPNVLHISGTGTLLGEIPIAGSVQALATDPDTGDLAVDLGARITVFDPSGHFKTEVASQTANGTAIALKGGRLYEFASDYSVNAYALGLATLPGAETPVVSNITGHSFHVSAEVEPGNPLPSESKAHFEYSADGGATWKSTPDQELSSSGVSTIQADLTGLLADFDYLVRFVASNAQIANTTKAAPVHTSVIAPDIETAAATDITETSAVLNGTINPNGHQTTYHFEYGTTSAYGSRIPAGIEAVAEGSRAVRAYARTIPGLQPGTTYHFRIVAQSSIGTSFGEDRTFTTTAPGNAIQRGYEQVTPIDKKGRPVTTHFAYLAKADGSELLYAYRGGDQSAPINSFAISSRGANDWHETDLSVPLNTIGPAGVVQQMAMGVSQDFSKQLVATNRKLTPGANEGGTNLYLVDVATHAYTLVATSEAGFAEGLSSFLGLQQAGKFIAGAPDFSWVLFKSHPPLLSGAPADALYRWSEDKGLEVVSREPGGAAEAATLGWASEDGSRVYFMGVGGIAEGPIYLHEDGQPTKAISVSHIEGDSTAPRMGQFFGASKDGRYAFFMSDEGRLTPDAPEPANPGQEGGVYRYDAVSEELEYLGAEAKRQGFEASIGVGGDGRTAYWRSLTGTVVWRDGAIKQVTPSLLLPGGGGPAGGTESNTELAVSPNGRYLGFEVFATRDVYLFDAETGISTCASCLPGGVSGGASLAYRELAINHELPNTVTNSGQLFYTATGRLVAADANGKADVYEYHDGHNTLISPGNAPFDALIADVSEDGSSVFFSTGQKLVGQDNDGSTDFYVARIGGGLASQNPPPPQECIRDDCKATPAPGPEVPFGGSEAIRGSENVTPKARCKKGTHARKVKGKTRCVKSSKAKKKQKKANSNRRQGR